MSVCPNTTSQEWRDLVAAHGEDGAYKRWLQNGKEIPEVSNVTMGNNIEVFKEIQKNTNANASINPDLDVTARIVKEREKNIIEINPNLLQNENIHEFGHVFVDLLGGLDNHIIKAGLFRLKGSNLEKELRSKNIDLSENEFKKELISLAIAKEGSEIWKTNSEKAKGISTWTNAFFKNLNKAIEIKESTARNLIKSTLKESLGKERVTQANIEEELYGRNAYKPKPGTASAKQQRLAERALGIITSKVDILKKQRDDRNKGQALVLAELIELQKELEKTRADLALAAFVTLAQKQTETILKKFREFEEGSADADLRTVRYLDTSMRAFDPKLLSDIEAELDSSQTGIQKELDQVITNQGKIAKAYKKVANDLLKKEFGDNVFKKTDAVFVRKAEIEFQKIDREKESPEKDIRRKAYVEKYLKDNAKEVLAAKEEKLDTFLTEIHKDISLWDSFVNNPKDMNSDIIRNIALMFDKSDFQVQEKSVFMARRAEAVFKRYEDYVGKTSDQKKFYAPLLEVSPDGNVLPRLAQRGSPEWAEIKSTGGKYKATPVEEAYDFLKELSEQTDKQIPARARLDGEVPVMNKNTLERVTSGSLWTALKEGTLDIWKLRKEDTESGHLEDESEDLKKENIRASMDDTVKVLSTQAGEERRIIPIHFRGKIKESDRSYDLFSLFVIDAHQANDYASKLEISATVEIALSLVEDAEVTQRSGWLGRVKENLGGQRQTDSKKESNTYKALARLIENRLYGIQTTGDAKTAKMSKKIKQYVSIINLFGNYLSAGANFTQGLAMVWMEGAGKQFYGLDNVLRAEKKYALDTASNVADMSRHRAKGKTNLLRELFNARSDWTVLANEFNKNNGLKRNASMGTGLALNSMAEHSVQSIGMYAVLDNIKVKNKDGKYINEQGEVVENRKDAMSIDEAYSVGYQHMKTKKTISQEAYDKLSETEKKNYMDGVLHLDENVASTERTKDEGTFEISQVLRRVNRDLFGNYDPKNRSALEAHAIGSMFSHMRQWMVPGFKKRYKGGHALFIRDKENAQKILGIKVGFRTIRSHELRDVDLDYNVETEAFEEGMYITTMRFVGVIMQDARALKAKVLSESWKDLTPYEKGNVRRTASEIAMSAAAYIVYVVLGSLLEDADDESLEEHALLLNAFYARRLLAELMTYSNPLEWAKTFRSPAVTLSLVENVLSALIQTATSPSEVYDRGKHKYENKALRKWRKVTPLKILDKDVEESLKWLKRNY